MAECAFRNKLKVSRPLLDSDLPEECGSRTIETLEYPHKTRTLKGWIEKLAKEELVRRDYGDTQKRYRTEDVAKALCSSHVRGKTSVAEIAKRHGVSRGCPAVSSLDFTL